MPCQSYKVNYSFKAVLNCSFTMMCFASVSVEYLGNKSPSVKIYHVCDWLISNWWMMANCFRYSIIYFTENLMNRWGLNTGGKHISPRKRKSKWCQVTHIFYPKAGLFVLICDSDVFFTAVTKINSDLGHICLIRTTVCCVWCLCYCSSGV